MRLYFRTLKFICASVVVMVILFPILIRFEGDQTKTMTRWMNIIELQMKKIYTEKLESSHLMTLTQGLIVDWWYDVCFERVPWDRTWHPLFPFFPQKSTRTLTAGDENRIVGNFLRRVSGFIHTNTSGLYEFKFLSRDGGDLLLLDTNTFYQNDSQLYTPIKLWNEILYLTLKRETMDIQEQKISLQEMFFTNITKVWLEARKLYFLEIIQGGRFFSKYQLHWRPSVGRKFHMIGKENLLSAKQMSQHISPLMEKTKLKQNYPPSKSKLLRNKFHEVPVLPTSKKIHASGFTCKQVNTTLVKISKLYDGYMKHIYKKHSAVYPQEYYKLTSKVLHERLVLDETFARDLANKIFDKLNLLHDGNLELREIVHIQENSKYKGENTKEENGYYFVELDVQLKNNDDNTYDGNNGKSTKIFRSSQYVRLSKSDDVCFVADYEWKENVQINLITPIRNQKVWLSYLIYMLKEVQEKTSERNINLILVDCDSKDGDYKSMLGKSNLTYQYVRMSDRVFSKVKALNGGLEKVKDDNSIVFVLDLHLQVPLNIFDRIRKLTIQGKTAFTPALMKLGCGEHEQYTPLKISLWLDSGVGMMAMYKSDWKKIGGYNEKLFKNKWGGEDWEVIDRVVSNGLVIIQSRLPDFYHIHHAKVGMWNGKQFKNNNFMF